jgi:hypothetical protein
MGKKSKEIKEKKLNKLEDYLFDAIDNIKTDRATTTMLLEELLFYLKGNPERHEKNGIVAAKYLETLQRSNEQLVKAIELLRKKNNDSNELTENDVEDIYDELVNKE